MQVSIMHYLELRHRYGHADGVPFAVTVDELADLFACTPRNVKLIVKRLVERGWIEWQAGRGRGHRSAMVFREPLAHVLLEAAQHAAEKGELREVFELLTRYGRETDALERFMEWLTGYFGVWAEPGGNRERQVLRMAVSRAPRTLDPAQSMFAFDLHLARQLFDTLVQFNRATKRIEPHLAHHWEASRDFTDWIFYLRRGVRFHDGRELTAEDVAFSLERLARESVRLTQGWMLEMLDRAEPIGRDAVRLRLREPNALLLRCLCTPGTSIMPRLHLEHEGDVFWNHPIGTGPFQLVQLTPERIELAAFEWYFQGRPHLDRVELSVVPDGMPLERLQPDWQQLFGQPSEECKRKYPDWQEIEQNYVGCAMLQFNLSADGPQRHREFRKAVHLLLDRERMIRDLGGHRTCPADGFFPPMAESVQGWGQQIDRAERLLAGIGYNGEPFTIGVRPKHREDAEWIRDRLAEHGIPVLLVDLPWDRCHADLRTEVDSMLTQWIMDEDEAALLEFYRHGGPLHRAFFGTEILKASERIIKRALRTPDESDRQRLLRELEELLRDSCAVLFLYHRSMNTLFHPSVRGVQFNSLGWIDFRHIWLMPETPAAAARNGAPGRAGTG